MKLYRMIIQFIIEYFSLIQTNYIAPEHVIYTITTRACFNSYLFKILKTCPWLLKEENRNISMHQWQWLYVPFNRKKP